MEPYSQIFPDLHDPVLTLVLEKKTGSVPRGTYGFIECYCTEPGCDCRRVTLLVLNEKTKQKAVICFGFDQKGPMAGPYLDTSHRQSPYAPDLLKFFAESLNSKPDWLDRMYRQYRSVREMVDGRPYRARPFPKPGQIVYRVMPPPDLEAEIKQSLKKLRASSQGAPPVRSGPRSGPPAHRELLAEAIYTGRRPSQSAARGIACFVERYRELGTSGPVANLLSVQDELRQYLAADELAEASFIESTPHYLDERVCQALWEGACRQSAPNSRLLQIAELLGCDRWRTTQFAARRELRQLREELSARQPKLLDEREYLAALEESASWHQAAPVFSSWFEEDDTVDREIENSRGKRRSVSAGAAIARIHRVVLEDRRAVWLERLVLTALWLKFSPRAPFAWHRVFHVAQAVSDHKVALSDIPLMLNVARLSFDAYLERRKAGSGRIGDRP